jgi:hypothetical protein
MSILSKLFGGGNGGDAKPSSEPVVYEGFRIFPEPIREGGQYRIAARIEKDVDGEVKTHQLIRADTLGDAGAASEASIGKAKMLIDQQGDRLFGGQ